MPEGATEWDEDEGGMPEEQWSEETECEPDESP